MNIEINLLPEELRPRPSVEPGTLLVIILIVALAAGCGFLIQAKMSVNSETESMQERVVAINKEVSTVSSNPEALTLVNSINRLKAVKGSYDTFRASRIEWGDTLERVTSNAPTGVAITALTQTANSLVVDGSASGFGAVTSYGRALDRDEKLALAGIPSLSGLVYSLIVRVMPGGGA